jgi:hypothetical protein
MSWVNCTACGMRHRVGLCPQKKAEEDAQRAAKARTARETGEAARALIDAGNAAAVARFKHEYAMGHPKELEKGEMFKVAQERRTADTTVVETLERYISQVMRQLRGE